MAGHIGQAAMTHACEALDVRIRRFPRCYQRRLRKLVKGSKQLRDLLYSFPAAAFVLAAGNRTPDARGRALRLTKDGRPLAEIAAALELPLWVRHVPPEAFAYPFGGLPDDIAFNRQIANLIPKAEGAEPSWLHSVGFLAESGSNDLALWFAKQRVRLVLPENSNPLLPLAAFAWFSMRKAGPGFGLIEKPWHRQMKFSEAASLARAWFARIILEYCMENKPDYGDWFKERKACGYRFLPLQTPEELREEGERMANCVGSYAGKVASGACLIYSIRRGGKRVATMEITPFSDQKHNGRIAQLERAGNTGADEPLRHAAKTWLAKRGAYPFVVADHIMQFRIHEGRWRILWGPFCEAKPEIGGSLHNPTPETLARMNRDLKALGLYAVGR